MLLCASFFYIHMTQFELIKLLCLSSIPRFGKKEVKLGPEQLMSIEFANNLKFWAIENKLSAVFTHIANEGKMNTLIGQILRCMGKIAGAPDYVFLWENGCGGIELKAEKGVMSENQKSFKLWCESKKVPYKVARSSKEGEEILKEWGVLKI